MIDKCLIGYPKSFIDFIMMFKDDFDIDYETFELLLPSAELVMEDTKQYDEYKKYCDCRVYTYLVTSKGELDSFIRYPISYDITYTLLRYGEKELGIYPETLYYVIKSIHEKDRKEHIDKMFPTSFTVQDFLKSTKKYESEKPKKLIRKK